MLKAQMLFHPDSPGDRVRVVRGVWGRLFKPRHFATLRECLMHHAWHSTDPGDDMKRYQSHKQVHATPMTRGDYNTYRGWTIPTDENPEDPGYLVVYNRGTEDHYESWSPKHVFDDGYTEIAD